MTFEIARDDLSGAEERKMNHPDGVRISGRWLKLVIAAFTLLAGCSQSTDKYEIVTVVKVGGIPWFNRMAEGVEQAARELDVDAYLIGPPQADEAQQVRMVEDLITKGVDAICVVPNDSQSLEPVFAKAQAAGIKIVTHESPSQRNHDYNIEAISNAEFGRYHVDKLVQLVGPNAEYAIFVGSLTAPTHRIWADEAEQHAQQTYPNLRLVTSRIPCSEEIDLAKQKTLELMKAYPNLKGILAFGSLGPPGAAQALREKGLQDQIAVVGTVIPSQAASYLQDGSIRHGVIWDPKPIGFAMVYSAKTLLDGETIADGMEVPRIGPIRLQGNNIELDCMLKITKDNARTFGF
jgi:simple sugar transport system substrate-binding protein